MVNKNLFPCIDISGTPYEIGYAHGKNYQNQVLHSIETYKIMFRDYSELSWEEGKEIAKRYINPIKKYNSDYIDEMQGVADGAGVEFEDILALNSRSEIVLQSGKNIEAQLDGCTSIGISPIKNDKNHTIVAHNWDWKATQKEAMVMMNIKQDNGKPTIHLITEAGIIGKTGFNSEGISLYLNALSVDDNPDGIPLHIAMRGILDSSTLSGAISAATKTQLGCCANFLIGHKSGEIIDIEISNNDFDILFPDNGYIVHTNHFVSPRLPKGDYIDTMRMKMPDTYLRYNRSKNILASMGSHIYIDEIKQLLSNHIDMPNSICRHADQDLEEGLRMETVFSIIINLTTNEMYFAPGNPCEEEYRHYQY